jgi:general secretion pathway protein J
MNGGNTAAHPAKKNRLQYAARGGFTLLELLISMSLLVVIIVLLMGAVRMGSRSMAAGEKKMEALERFRSVLSIIDAQIQSHAPLTYQEEGNKIYYFRGNAKSLRFTTNYSIWSGQRGYVIADYKIEGDNSGKEIMSAGEQVPGVEGRRTVRFLEATAISFEYFWKDPTEEQGKWVESLTDGTAIPERIRINLMTGIKNFSMVFPVRVGGKIMAIQGGTPVAASPKKSIPTQAK